VQDLTRKPLQDSEMAAS